MKSLRVAACLFGLAVGGLLLIILIVPNLAPWIDRDQLGQMAWVGMYGAFALALLASLASRYRGGLSLAFSHLAIWVLIFLVFVAFYAYRDDLRTVGERIFSELSPGEVSTPAPGVASVARRLDGEYVVRASINRFPLRLVFDTGASTIELRAEDADRLGLPVARLNYGVRVDTANGETFAAPVQLDSVSVGDITVDNVEALVAKPGALRESLLGRSFLDRLRGYSVDQSKLVMRGK